MDAERQRISIRLGQINTWTEKAYQDKLEGTITAEHWKTLFSKRETERIRLQSQLETLNGNGRDVLMTAERILVLSQKFPDLWLSRNDDEKRGLVDFLYWNCTLDGATPSAAYKKPFSILAEGKKKKKRRALRDDFPINVALLEVVGRHAVYPFCATPLTRSIAASA